MHILELIAENYKRLRVVEITPKGRVVQITGNVGIVLEDGQIKAEGEE